MNSNTLLVLLVASLLAGCNSYPISSSPPIDLPEEEVDKTPQPDCDRLVDHLKGIFIESMRVRIKDNLALALQPEECPGDLCGEPDVRGGGCGCGCGCSIVSLSPIDGPSGADPTPDPQGQMPDEPDIVKHDGRFIYVLGDRGLQVVDARPAPSARVVSTIPIEGYPESMHLADGRILVFSRVDLSGEDFTCSRAGGRLYCYGIDLASKVTVVDVSSRARPVVAREILIPGRLMTSRQIAGSVHTAVQCILGQPEPLPDWPEDLPRRGGQDHDVATAAFEKLQQENERRIRETGMEVWLPLMHDTRHRPGRGDLRVTCPLLSCRDVLRQSPETGSDILSVLSLRPDEAVDVNLASVLGAYAHIHSSGSSLYATRTHLPGEDEPQGESTEIVKFSITSAPPGATREAGGFVEGRIPSRTSLDEHNGYLRVATSNIGWLDDPADNAVLVLGQDGPALETVGAITGITPGDSVRSARFVGDRGFLDTYDTDAPLVTLDLSDPRNPSVAGTIDNPAQLTLLQPAGPDHLLAIHTTFSLNSLQLRMFDILDLSRPTEIHATHPEMNLNRFWTMCDNRGFSYLPEQALLTMPVNACERTEDPVVVGGLVVWDVVHGTGFSERGRIPFGLPTDPRQSDWEDDSCSWALYGTIVKRSIVLDDYVFTISDKYLKVTHLDDLATDVRVVELQEPGE